MILQSEERLKLQCGNAVWNGARFGFLNREREFINCLKFYNMQLFVKGIKIIINYRLT